MHANAEALDFPRIVSPMQNGLALFGAAMEVAGEAVFADLGDVAIDGFPSFDLALVFFVHTAAEVVAAIPLEPATGVEWVDPVFFAPNGKGLGGVDAKVV